MVGELDTVLHTTDRGLSWQRVDNIAPFKLEGGDLCADCDRYTWYGVSFLNTSMGWVVGSYGAVVHTRDGGATWTAQETSLGGYGSAFPVTLHAVQAVSEGLAVACGERDTIIRTRDRGATWQSLYARTSGMHFRSVFFVSELEGWAVGAQEVSGPTSKVLRTVNGGDSWQFQAVSPPVAALHGLHFTTASEGWAVGTAGAIVHTQDAGATWHHLGASTSAGAGGQSHGGDTGWDRGRVTRDLYGVSVDPISQYGFAVGENGVLVWSLDGGATWREQIDGGSGSNDGVNLYAVEQWAQSAADLSERAGCYTNGMLANGDIGQIKTVGDRADPDILYNEGKAEGDKVTDESWFVPVVVGAIIFAFSMILGLGVSAMFAEYKKSKLPPEILVLTEIPSKTVTPNSSPQSLRSSLTSVGSGSVGGWVTGSPSASTPMLPPLKTQVGGRDTPDLSTMSGTPIHVVRI